MSITLSPIAFPTDRDALVQFLTSNAFPFHVRTWLSVAEVHERIASGRFAAPDHEAFWIDTAAGDRVGCIVLDDLTDATAMFDLRLATEFRGQGLGVPILRAMTRHVFTQWPETHRFEGDTREDNIAMRRTFVRAGFVKEAHYREGWPVDGGRPLAAVAYAILRRDWEAGTTTTFEWDDLAEGR